MNELNRKRLGRNEFQEARKIVSPRGRILNEDTREYIAPYFRRPIKQNFYDASYIAPPGKPFYIRALGRRQPLFRNRDLISARATGLATGAIARNRYSKSTTLPVSRIQTSISFLPSSSEFKFIRDLTNYRIQNRQNRTDATKRRGQFDYFSFFFFPFSILDTRYRESNTRERKKKAMLATGRKHQTPEKGGVWKIGKRLSLARNDSI